MGSPSSNDGHGPDAPAEHGRNGLLALALASFVGSGVAIFWAVCMFTWSLPETDGAYGTVPFTNPFVFVVSGMFLTAAWLVTFCASVFTLRHAPLTSSFLRTLLAALVTMTIATPLFALEGALLSLPVTIGCMVYYRRKFPAPASHD